MFDGVRKARPRTAEPEAVGSNGNGASCGDSTVEWRGASEMILRDLRGFVIADGGLASLATVEEK